MLRQFSLITSTCLRRVVRTELITKQLTFPSCENCFVFIPIRNKHVTSGIQGRRNSKTPPKKYTEEDSDDDAFFQGTTDEDQKVSLGDRYMLTKVNFQFALHSLKVLFCISSK